MASMQSSRTQCCCCTIGVFATLFGVIMLSAGICIVINVNVMDVDTSGLPPELHNDDGKTVVGVILICVALGSLGLSVTVSIIYFAVCNRRPRNATTTNGTNAAASVEAGGTNNINGGRGNNSTSQNGRASSSQHGHQRSSDASRLSSDSQLSLNSLPRQRRPSPALTPSRATGLKKKAHKAKNHRMRQPRYHTGLSPHIEEPETAKSQVDLKLHQTGLSSEEAAASTSQQDGSQSQPSTSYVVDETRTITPTDSTSSFRSDVPPKIVINGINTTYGPMTSSLVLPNSGSKSADINNPSVSMSLSLANPGESLALTEESTLYDDETETDETSLSHFPSHDPLPPTSSPDNKSSSSYENDTDLKHQPSSSATSSHPHQHSPSEQTSSSSIPQSKAHSPSVASEVSPVIPSNEKAGLQNGEEASLDSSLSYDMSVVHVQPQSGLDLDSPYLQSTAEADADIKNSNSTPADKPYVIKDSNYSNLPMSSRHHEIYADPNDKEGSDRRSESQSSFNSGFSNEGGDPSDEEMRKMHEKMKALLK